MNACAAMTDEGVIRGVLGAVDCQTRNFAEAGYSALTQSSSGFQVALTALLTIYVALIGYRMLFAAGGARLSDAPGIALRIGAILALVTSWPTFQTLVFDVAARAPLEIAAIVTAPMAEGSALAASPIAGLQIAYDQLSQSAVAYGKIAGPNVKAYASPAAGAAEALSTASAVLFMASAGVIAAATLAIGVLTAVGPLFIALLLIPATRGLFAGWVRALVAAAFVTLLGWLVIVLMLTALEPWLVSLAEQRNNLTPNAQTAVSAAALVFVFGAGQAALVISACVMAFGFRMPRAALGSDRPAPATAAAEGAALPEASRAQRLAFDLQRDQAMAASSTRLHPASLMTSNSTTTTVTQTSASAPSSRPARLGETYRRPAAPRSTGGRA